MTVEFIAPPCAAELEIQYQDQHLLVLDKPSGLLSVPGQNPLNKDSVLERLKIDFPQVKLVHRLDFGTSGLMVAALSDLAIKNLNHQFSQRQVQKQYTALLAGELASQSGQITGSIARAEFPLQKICELSGKRSLSRFDVVSHEFAPCGFPLTRVRYFPETGRTHQLRLHSLSIGHPICGCDLYHSEVQANGVTLDSRQLADRLLLHASALSFANPVSGEPLTFNCPPDF